MTLQWTLVAYFLYAEIGLVTLLMLPFISASHWNHLFNMVFLKNLRLHANNYFRFILAILAVLFMDSIRLINKYDHEEGKNARIKEMRAQRNFYISGMAIFLWFVMNRMIGLIATNAATHIETTDKIKKKEN